MSKLYHITYSKELHDTLKLIELINSDKWIDSNTILVTCSPDYSSNVTQLINHKLSYLNFNELYEQLFLELPYPVMNQVWDRETQQYVNFDKYLISWIARYIKSDFKYLFIDSATLSGRNFSKIKMALRDKVEARFASIYLQEGSKFTPDYFAEQFNKDVKGGIIFEWENADNKNWNY